MKIKELRNPEGHEIKLTAPDSDCSNYKEHNQDRQPRFVRDKSTWWLPIAAAFLPKYGIVLTKQSLIETISRRQVRLNTVTQGSWATEFM